MTLALEREGQEDQKFKVTLVYTSSLRATWDTCRTLSQRGKEVASLAVAEECYTCAGSSKNLMLSEVEDEQEKSVREGELGSSQSPGGE